MKPWAYYNEHEPFAAQWLRNLIEAGLIAPGEVDERDIRDVTPEQLSGFVQCHFFAGIGIWSGALRAAGWPDDREIWSGSCPCQPFSPAGRGEGTADERHLWPHWFWLIGQRRPGVLVGEQVAGKDGLGWNDLVSADLGGADYAFGPVNLCAAGFGLEWGRSAYAEWLERALHDCPDPLVARQICDFADWSRQSLSVGGLHIRQRQYFVGLANEQIRGRGVGGDASLARPGGHPDGGGDPTDWLAHADEQGDGRRGDDRPSEIAGESDGASFERPTGFRAVGLVGEPSGPRPQGLAGHGDHGDQSGRLGADEARSAAAAGEPLGLSDADDDQQRPGRGAGREGGARDEPRPQSSGRGETDGLADADGGDAGERSIQRDDQHGLGAQDRGGAGIEYSGPRPETDRGAGPSSPDGGRSPFDWLLCRDGVWRAVESCPQSSLDAIAEGVGPVRPDLQQEVEETVNAKWPEPSGGALLRDLLQAASATALSEEQSPRKSRPVWEAAVLLTFVRQLAAQGWELARESLLSLGETPGPEVRGVPSDGKSLGSSCGPELAERQPVELSDAVSHLSQFLAQKAAAAWGNLADSYASAGLPLAHAVKDRVGRLRAYGNGLDFETATAFCKVVREIIDE